MKQRITVCLPEYVYRKLKKRVPKNQVSRFVSEAVEEKLPALLVAGDPIEEFLAASKTSKKQTDEKIFAAIRRGRT